MATLSYWPDASDLSLPDARMRVSLRAGQLMHARHSGCAAIGGGARSARMARGMEAACDRVVPDYSLWR